MTKIAKNMYPQPLDAYKQGVSEVFRGENTGQRGNILPKIKNTRL